MMLELFAMDYKINNDKKLKEAKQIVGQSTAAFIYRIYNLSKWIDNDILEAFTLNLIKMKLLPAIEYANRTSESKCIARTNN